MLKVYGPSIFKPLEVIFNQCTETGFFPSEWKKGNIVPIHKKAANKHRKTTVQYRCYLFLGKFLKDYYLMNYSNFLLKVNSFL